MPKAKYFYITTAGTMGCGKTTVAHLIAKHLGCHLMLENFGENQFLPRFYKDMRRWAFHSQTFYLIEKITQMLEAKQLLKKTSIVQDTAIYQDVLSYARAQFILGNMDEAEFTLYTKIYASFKDYLLEPDIIVYLSAPLAVLLDRVAKRPHSIEGKQKYSYLKILDDFNKNWIKQQPGGKVIYVDTLKKNFVDKPKDIAELMDIIRDKITFLTNL